MPRHTFRFPAHIRAAVQQYVEGAIASLPTTQFRQAPNYTAALAAKLQGTAYSRPDGSVIFSVTPIDDRARNSAESIFGADLAFTAEISRDGESIRKAILIQAKLGTIDELKKADMRVDQIEKMQRATRSPKVMELPINGNVYSPQILSATRIIQNAAYRPMRLSQYITSRVLTTLDGDTRPDFVDAVKDSSLLQLRIQARSTERRSDRVKP